MEKPTLIENRQLSGSGSKKTYSPPRIVEYGDIANITQNGGPSTDDMYPSQGGLM